MCAWARVQNSFPLSLGCKITGFQNKFHRVLKCQGICSAKRRYIHNLYQSAGCLQWGSWYFSSVTPGQWLSGKLCSVKAMPRPILSNSFSTQDLGQRTVSMLSWLTHPPFRWKNKNRFPVRFSVLVIPYKVREKLVYSSTKRFFFLLLVLTFRIYT